MTRLIQDRGEISSTMYSLLKLAVEHRLENISAHNTEET